MKKEKNKVGRGSICKVGLSLKILIDQFNAQLGKWKLKDRYGLKHSGIPELDKIMQSIKQR